LGIVNTGGEAKCALWADLDGDGDQDLFVTQRLAPNRLYARMPDGSLQEVPNAGGMAGTSLERAYGASIADYDQDQRLDVYVC
ncbi:MAG: FG-GAP-like repeat-containing protein, partial [Flavobacteriales bacterium]|nr:FG-GAP-like repeat-containing protein [Flavobacteriales bacterium]